jgi:hypothetical protein
VAEGLMGRSLGLFNAGVVESSVKAESLALRFS